MGIMMSRHQSLVSKMDILPPQNRVLSQNLTLIIGNYSRQEKKFTKKLEKKMETVKTKAKKNFEKAKKSVISKFYKEKKKINIYCRETVRGADYLKEANKAKFQGKFKPCQSWEKSFDMVQYLNKTDPERIKEELWVRGENGLIFRMSNFENTFGTTKQCRNLGNLFPQPSCLVIAKEATKRKAPVFSLEPCQIPVCSYNRGPYAGQTCRVTGHGREMDHRFCRPFPGYPLS